MLDPVLSHWLDAEAEALDLGHSDPQHVLSQLASANGTRAMLATSQLSCAARLHARFTASREISRA